MQVVYVEHVWGDKRTARDSSRNSMHTSCFMTTDGDSCSSEIMMFKSKQRSIEYYSVNEDAMGGYTNTNGSHVDMPCRKKGFLWCPFLFFAHARRQWTNCGFAIKYMTALEIYDPPN